MGITVLSTANTAAAANLLAGLSASGSGSPAEGLPADFAMLLAQLGGNDFGIGQQSDAIQLNQGTSGELLPDTGKGTEELSAADLAAAIQNALPFMPPAVANAIANGVDRSNAEKVGENAEDTLLDPGQQIAPGLFTDGKPGKHETGAIVSGDALGKALPGTGQAASNIPLAPPSAATLSQLPDTGLKAKPGEPANIAVESAPTAPLPSSFSAAMVTASAQASGGTTQAAPASTHIPTPLHDQQWGQNFGEKIVWLAKSEQQTAQININPPQLGPIQINLSINGDQASAIFTSPHAEVRQAIEDAMPRLREMLNGAGINLGQANVGAQLPQQNREAPPQFANGARFSDETAILPGDSTAAPGALAVQRGRGLVDLFA